MVDIETKIRREIIPGTYGRIKVEICKETGLTLYGFTSCNDRHFTTLTADEIEAAMETLDQLHSIAMENEGII